MRFRPFTTKSDIFWEKQHGLINEEAIIGGFGIKPENVA